MLAWLSVGNEVQMIYIWSSWWHCHPVVSCFMKIKIALVFLVPAYPGCPGKEACQCVPLSVCLKFPRYVQSVPRYCCMVNTKGAFMLTWFIYPTVTKPTREWLRPWRLAKWNRSVCICVRSFSFCTNILMDAAIRHCDYQLADNRRLTIGRLPINTKSYENLTLLPFEIEKSCWSRFLHYELQ